MNNKEIRWLIFDNNLKKYEVAEKIGITVPTFSRWLQTEMDELHKKKTLNAIKELLKEQ